MSQAEARLLLAVALVLPFPFSAITAASGGAARMRRMLAAGYALAAAGVNLALLNGFLTVGRDLSWGPFRTDRFTFPLFLMLSLVSAAAVLYAGFRREAGPHPALLNASILAASGLAAMALASDGLVLQVSLWEGVTVAALVGLAAGGAPAWRKRLAAFAPWLVADALFIAGAVLCVVLLDETGVFIKPPLTKGSEAQVVAIAVLFLGSSLIRLGVFPFDFWVRGVIEVSEAQWSAFFMGAVNYLLAGTRLVVGVVFLGRLVASDWGLALTIVGLVSVLAGPVIALRRGTVSGYLSGMYTLQAGFLVTGLGLFSRAGLDGALFCLLVSPLFLTACMMAAGTVKSLRGTAELDRNTVQAGLAPAAFIVFVVSGMSLAGLPPMDGFVGKALVALGLFDKSADGALYALAAGLALAAIAAATAAVVRTTGGVFAPAGSGVPAAKRQSPVEGIAALALCGASMMLGVFPGLLLSNFVRAGSTILFTSGFTGPGIAFRGTGDAAGRALGLYPAWGATVATFLLAASAIVLAAYFASRAAHPSADLNGSGRLEPFLAGASGDYRHAPLTSLGAGRLPLPVRWRGR